VISVLNNVEVRHSESWYLAITPAEGGQWENCPVPHLTKGQMMQPRRISVHMVRGDRHLAITLLGVRIKANGEPGEQKVRSRLWGKETGYDWVWEAVEHARRLSQLGPSRTGVDW
jgi:hypothetical protein